MSHGQVAVSNGHQLTERHRLDFRSWHAFTDLSLTPRTLLPRGARRRLRITYFRSPLAIGCYSECKIHVVVHIVMACERRFVEAIRANDRVGPMGRVNAVSDNAAVKSFFALAAATGPLTIHELVAATGMTIGQIRYALARPLVECIVVMDGRQGLKSTRYRLK